MAPRKTTIARSMLFCLATTVMFIMPPAGLLAQTLNVVAPGHVEGAGPTLSIGSAASGKVSEVLVHEGSRVRAGETLIKLDCKPVEAEIRARQAQLDATQAAFDPPITALAATRSRSERPSWGTRKRAPMRRQRKMWEKKPSSVSKPRTMAVVTISQNTAGRCCRLSGR